MTSQRRRSLTNISCPGSFLGALHPAVYDKSDGTFKCFECGLAGTPKGLETLIQLEAKLYQLSGELDIKRFEIELSERGAA